MTDHRLTLATDDAINQASLAIQAGERVAFPTETVYGLGADATNDRAIAGIFHAKDRPHFNPLIVHFSNFEHAELYAEFSDLALILATHFWPGGLTLVVNRKLDCRLSKLVSAGLETVAVRVPANGIAQKLLRLSKRPIAAPSANRSGTISSTQASHVSASLDANNTDSPAIILDGGPCLLGIESTVVDVTTDKAMLLRPGAISTDDIEAVIGPLTTADANSHIKSPGMLSRHYAPKMPMRLNVTSALDQEQLLAFGPNAPESAVLNLSDKGDLVEAAANLFSMMHELDHHPDKSIAVMPIPNTGLGIAINDRLARAAQGTDVGDDR